MKKITFGVLLFTSSLAFAQLTSVPATIGSTNNLKGLHPVGIGATKTPRTQSTSMHQIFDFPTNIYQYQTTFGVSSSNFQVYLNPVFMDSSVESTSSAGNTYIQDMRAGVMLDPTSAIWDTTNWTTSPIDAYMPYNFDTLLVVARYQSVNVGVSDTLMVEIEYGPPSDFGGIYTIASPSESWAVPFVNDSKLYGNVSNLLPHAATMVKIKRVLTVKDTAVVTALKYPGCIIVPTNLAIPAGNIVAATCTFVPGQKYSKGDICFTYEGGSGQNQNGLGVDLWGQSASLTSYNNYFYDSTNLTNPEPRGLNTGYSYGPTARFGLYSGSEAFYDTMMAPSSNFVWWMDFILTYNQSTGIKEVQASGLKVNQNVPNPFSDITTVNYSLPQTEAVNLDVYDITGKKVQTVTEGTMTSGAHTIQLNSANLQAGVYFYTLSAGEDRITKRMVVLK